MLHITIMSSKAVQIVTFENKGRKTRAHIEEARLREIINKGAMNLPTMVISIGGQARTGKSFLLNLFITYLSYIEQNRSDRGWESSSMPVEGVNWAQNRQAVTMGIWMWHMPFIITQHDGRKIAVLLVDSQGTGDNRKSDVKLDTLIMYISLQLSSVQVLNVKTYLTSNEMISLKMCESYEGFSGRDQKQGGEDDYLFPSLVFLIRDHQNDNHFGEDRNAFRDIVRDVENEELKDVVYGIKNAFKNVTTFNMPNPGDSVTRASAGTKHWKVRDIPSQFLLVAREIIKKLCSLTKSDSAGSSWDSGQEILTNFKVLKDHLENDDLPQITSPMEALLETIVYKAFTSSRKIFLQDAKQMFEGSGSYLNPEQLEAKLKRLEEIAEAHFRKVGRAEKNSRTQTWRKYETMLHSDFKTARNDLKVKQLEQENKRMEGHVSKLTSKVDGTRRQLKEAEGKSAALEQSLEESKRRMRQEMDEQRRENDKIRRRQQQEIEEQRSRQQQERSYHEDQIERVTRQMKKIEVNERRQSPMGMSPMGMSPMGMSPMGMSPMGMNPMGMSLMGMNPMGISPMGMDPMRMGSMGRNQQGASCDICGQICKNSHGVAIHKGRMHK